MCFRDETLGLQNPAGSPEACQEARGDAALRGGWQFGMD